MYWNSMSAWGTLSIVDISVSPSDVQRATERLWWVDERFYQWPLTDTWPVYDKADHQAPVCRGATTWSGDRPHVSQHAERARTRSARYNSKHSIHIFWCLSTCNRARTWTARYSSIQSTWSDVSQHVERAGTWTARYSSIQSTWFDVSQHAERVGTWAARYSSIQSTWSDVSQHAERVGAWTARYSSRHSIHMIWCLSTCREGGNIDCQVQ